jgi:hypothetical protein
MSGYVREVLARVGLVKEGRRWKLGRWLWLDWGSCPESLPCPACQERNLVFWMTAGLLGIERDAAPQAPNVRLLDWNPRRRTLYHRQLPIHMLLGHTH